MVDTQPVEVTRAYWSRLIDDRLSSRWLAPETIKSELDVLAGLIAKARNSYLGFGRLPPEVMVSIFTIVRDVWPLSRFVDAGENLRFLSGWLVITHVASSWRHIALGTPSLWAKHTDVLNTHPNYLPLILSRSRDCPLAISFDFLARTGPLLEEGLLHPHDNTLTRALHWVSRSVFLRTESLSVNGFSEDLSTALDSLPPQSLHNVRSLKLSTKQEPYHILPQSLAGLSTVTYLSLDGFYTPWNSSIFSDNLTHLDLSTDYEALERENLLPSCSELQTALNAMRSLQALSMRDLVPGGLVGEVHLPQTLRFFGFKLGYYHITKFTQSLRFLAQLKLGDTCARFALLCLIEGNGIELSEMQPELFTLCINNFTRFRCGAPQEMAFGLLTIGTTTEEQARRIWLEAVNPSESEYAIDDQDEILYDRLLANPFGDYYNVARFGATGLEVCGCIDSLNIEDLRVANFTNILCSELNEMDRWAEISLRAPRLRVIGIFISESLPFLHSLMNVVSIRLESFPSLEIIVFNGVGQRGAYEDGYVAELTALTGLVHLRKTAGTPLREIVISKAAEAWGVWDSLRRDVEVTFL